MANISLKMPSPAAIDKHFKLLTENEIERKKRIRKEQDRQKKQELQIQRRREYAKWAYDYVKENFKDLKEDYINKLDIESVRDTLSKEDFIKKDYIRLIKDQEASSGNK